VNGTKTWNTLGQYADWIFCLVRTDNTVKKQEGISFLLIDMKTAGIKLSPIVLLDGEPEVNEVHFDNVKVPKENLLPNKSGLGAPLGCLDSARYGIAWGAIGAAMDCYDTALRYAKERIQFDKPIAGTQLQQKKLAEMITEITKAQLLTWRLGVLRNEGRATTAQISMAKRNNVDMAINIAREARQILGAMGIIGDYSIMRHMMNLESVITYEGTHDIHLLITGMDITGISSFRVD
jgi:glutaryl-CoA dehydrogenase